MADNTKSTKPVVVRVTGFTMPPTTAILVDGGFYLKRARALAGEKAPKDRAEELFKYCQGLLYHNNDPRAALYRIFYYDCPPANKVVYNPLTQKQDDLSQTPLYRWMTDFHEELRKKRKVALRLGRLSSDNLHYTLNYDAIKKLLRGDLAIDNLEQHHFSLNIVQKGVDIKLSSDIASMAYKKQINQIVLISGDSDFVPIAKLARREGIDFLLDSMGQTVSSDLSEHVDGFRSNWGSFKAK